MRTKILSILALLISSPLVVRADDPSAFADRIFLCFEGGGSNAQVAGSNTVPGYESCVEALSISYGVENATSIGSASGGAGSGKVKFSEFVFKKLVDRASPALFKAAALGAHFDKVRVSFVRVPTKKGAITETLRLILKLAFVTKIETAAAAGDLVTENVSLAYGALAFQVATGDTCFDTVSNSDGGLCSEN